VRGESLCFRALGFGFRFQDLGLGFRAFGILGFEFRV
jgi:hypothetical protein